VVLVEPEKDGNIGSIARIMKNFGLEDLFLVNPKVPLGIEARAYASHAWDIIENAVIENNLDKAIDGVRWVVGTTAIFGIRSRNIRRTSITAEEFAERISSIKGKVAILFGRESKGLSNMELEKCDVLVTIPTSPKYRSLNIAVASSIILYELYKIEKKIGRAFIEEVDKSQKERLINFFSALAIESGLHEYKSKLAVRSFHNVIGRAFISKREASLIMGVFRRSLRRIRFKREV
jgi:TrmH family RNA methyltransferase